MRRERLRKRRFIFFSNMVYYGAVVVLTLETFVTLESVVELFLYYGKCIFPVLYGIPYTPPISEEQLPQFYMALVIISCIKYICSTFGVILIFLPPLVFSFAFFINALNDARKQRLLPYRFSGNVHSQLNRHLIYNFNEGTNSDPIVYSLNVIYICLYTCILFICHLHFFKLYFPFL